jgi:hypothetical protein
MSSSTRKLSCSKFDLELLAHRAVFDCSLRSRRIAPGSRLLRPRSQTVERVCSLVLSTAARDPVFDCSLRSRRIAPGSRLLRPRSQTVERVCSLVLSTAARDPVFDCSLRSRSRREAAYFVFARRREACLLVHSSRTAARQLGSARQYAIADARS